MTAAQTPTLFDGRAAQTAADIAATPDNRALGAVMRRAATDGLIAATNELRPSQRVSLHGSPRRIWRSLVFGAGGAKEVRS